MDDPIASVPRPAAPGHARPSPPPAGRGSEEAGIGTPVPPRPPPDFGVWELAWPSMLMFGLHALVGVVDFAFVSGFGTVAVASVGVAIQIHFIVFAVLGAVTAGTVAVVAREAGAGRWGEVGDATRSSVAISSLLALLLMGIAPFTTPLIARLGVTPEVAELGGDCLALLLLFNVPLAIGVVLSMALRSAGDVRTPLLVGIAANALNVAGDYALVFGHWGAPAMGARGSALASGLSFAFGAIALGTLWARDRLILPRGDWRASLTLGRARRLLRIGLPTAVEQMSFQLGLLVFLGLVADYGTPPVSAYLIGVRILSLCFVPGLGFSTAASTLVGQHLGADRPDLAARQGWRANFGAMAVMGSVGLAIVASAPRLAEIFGAAGDETIRLAVVFIYILGAAQPLMAMEFALGGALRGAGDTRFPLFAMLTGLFVFRLGAAFLIARPFFDTVTAIWCCLLADYLVKGALLAWRFASGGWTRVRV